MSVAGDAEVSARRAFAEAAVLLSGLFVGVIVAGYLGTKLLQLPPMLLQPWSFAVGLPMAAAGAAALASFGAFLSHHGRGTPYPRRPPQELVTAGPFARVRNPLILAWGVAVLGIGIAMNWTGLVLLLIPLAVVVHVYVVYHEEPILTRRFGAEYEEYRERVPRWIPRFRP